MRSQFFKLNILLLIAVTVITTGFRCTFISPAEKELLEPIALNWWGVFDDFDAFSEIINEYKLIHPNITVNYRRLRPEEFTLELLDALAEDRGPDIVTLQNTQLGQFQSKLAALPPTTRMAYQVTQKSLGVKQETLVEVRETPSLTAGQIKNNFLDVVYDDVIRGNQIYGLPAYVDTLALFYNRDLFNNAGIPLPPTTWTQVQDFVSQLTFQDSAGNLIQSGIALGLADNVERYFDIISLLMMQNGAEMTRENRAAFNVVPVGGDSSYNPGPEALRFYADFADPTKASYTWNESFPSSIDAFAAGQAAMMLGYAYHIPTLEAKRLGKLNYGIAKIPQIEGRPPVNYANYQIYTVSNKSKYVNEAWDLIQFLTRADQVTKYLNKTGKPTALRALINEQEANDVLKPFAQQLLTTKSWYRGSNIDFAEATFGEMITTTAAGEAPQKAASLAAEKISQAL